MAEQLHKPVVVHCVRAYNERIELRRQYASTPWVVHGYSGSPQLAMQLKDKGIYVSLGAALLDPARSKPRQTLLQLGADNILLETDTATCGIESVYQSAAQLLGISVDLLADKIARTHGAVMGLSRPNGSNANLFGLSRPNGSNANLFGLSRPNGSNANLFG